MFCSRQPTQFRLEKKNLLTFSATTNACLTKRRKGKKKECNEGSRILLVYSLLFSPSNRNPTTGCNEGEFSRVTQPPEHTVWLTTFHFFIWAFAYFKFVYFTSPVMCLSEPFSLVCDWDEQFQNESCDISPCALLCPSTTLTIFIFTDDPVVITVVRLYSMILSVLLRHLGKVVVCDYWFVSGLGALIWFSFCCWP